MCAQDEQQMIATRDRSYPFSGSDAAAQKLETKPYWTRIGGKFSATTDQDGTGT
jgi:hypothetical protein